PRPKSEPSPCRPRLRHLTRLVLFVPTNAGLTAAFFFYSPAPANRLAVFSTAGRRASAGPQIHVFLAMLPCPSKRAIPGSSKTNRRAHTPSIKTEVMDLLTERARSACRDAD